MSSTGSDGKMGEGMKSALILGCILALGTAVSVGGVLARVVSLYSHVL